MGKDFIISSGSDTGALWGGFLEVIVALAGIGTAITLYPVVKRQNEAMALGFVASRTLEAAMLFTGVASILSLVTLHQDLGTATGADTATLVTVGASHVATYHWAFTLGGSLMPGINAILLGTLLYQSGLVPRVIPLIGLIGAPLHLTAVVLTMFGVVDRVGTVTGIAVIPIAVWEFSLGVYLIVKGFKPCPITDEMDAAATTPPPNATSSPDVRNTAGPTTGAAADRAGGRARRSRRPSTAETPGPAWVGVRLPEAGAGAGDPGQVRDVPPRAGWSAPAACATRAMANSLRLRPGHEEEGDLGDELPSAALQVALLQPSHHRLGVRLRPGCDTLAAVRCR